MSDLRPPHCLLDVNENYISKNPLYDGEMEVAITDGGGSGGGGSGSGVRRRCQTSDQRLVKRRRTTDKAGHGMPSKPAWTRHMVRLSTKNNPTLKSIDELCVDEKPNGNADHVMTVDHVMTADHVMTTDRSSETMDEDDYVTDASSGLLS